MEQKSQYTDFTDQDLVLYCPGYECTDRGVRTDAGKEVCMHPILPTGALQNAEDGTLSLVLAFNARGYWEERTVPAETLASAAGVVKLAGLGVAVTSANARALSEYLLRLYHLNTDVIRLKQSLSRLGWLGACAGEFAPYSADVKYDGDPRFAQKYRAVHVSGSEEAWIAAVRPLWKSNPAARLVIDASLASVLLTPMDLQPFFVHIWGKTGLGKTVLLQLAASVWGDPRPGKLITTFNATAVGLEMTAGFLHDLPMCIDELQIRAAAGASDFQQTVYTLAEGVGRARGAKDGGLRKTPTWRNVFITTGERPMSDERTGGGAMNRNIELELTSPVTGDFAGLIAAVGDNYGWAGERFVRFTREHLDLMRHHQGETAKELCALGVTGKQASAMAAMLTADLTAAILFFEPETHVSDYTVAEAAKLLLKEDAVCAEARALEYLFDTIAANPARFPEKPSADRNIEVWGKPVAEYTAVIGAVFDRIMTEGGFSPRAVLAYAKRRGLLQTDDKQYKKTMRIGKSAIRCIVIKQEV